MFKRKTKVQFQAKIPDDVCVYAIGDIHGNLDLLEKMHQEILRDAKNRKPAKKIIIYLGDYIDRGLESKAVIDLLVNNPMSEFEKIYLRGNHEVAMLNFLENKNNSDCWLSWGGLATISSYKIKMHNDNSTRRSAKDLSERLNYEIPQNHKDFFRKLELKYIIGDYLFVHAGIKPGVKIEKQKELDLISIREEFTLSDESFEKKVVFGHSIFDKPLLQHNKIGIDTGAYVSGNLSCVVLEEENVNFLTVSRSSNKEMGYN